MSPIRIYADFNGLVNGVKNPERTAVVLDTYGSLKDLSNLGVILKIDLPIIAFDASDEDEDLEGHGTAQFDSIHKWWVVEFDEVGVRDVPAGDRTPIKKFLCVSCREDLYNFSQGKMVNVTSPCPNCGEDIRKPYESPS